MLQNERKFGTAQNQKLKGVSTDVTEWTKVWHSLKPKTKKEMSIELACMLAT